MLVNQSKATYQQQRIRITDIREREIYYCYKDTCMMTEHYYYTIHIPYMLPFTQQHIHRTVTNSTI